MSLYIISAACLIAVFAYPLAPDGSPGAARMLKELKAKPPGFSRQFLKVPLRQAPRKKSFIAALFTGAEPSCSLVPVNDFFFARDTLVVQHYIGLGVQDTLVFLLKHLQPPTSNFQQSLGRQQRQVAGEAITRRTFLLGTDRYGRDILSRIIIGTRISLGVGFVAMLISLGIGLLLGVLAGYCRGWVDHLVMYLANVLTAIPWPLLAFGITLSLGRGFWQIAVAVGLVMWAGTARLVREEVLVLREREWVRSAQLLGLSNMRILIRHILPNMAASLLALAAANVASGMLAEAGLSFLGIGMQPPAPSWGGMMREQWAFLPAGRAALALIPGVALVVLAGAFQMLSHLLREAPVDELH